MSTDKRLGSILSSITAKKNDIDLVKIAYLCSREFGWSQQEFESAEIPYVLGLLRCHKERLDAEERAMRKKK